MRKHVYTTLPALLLSATINITAQNQTPSHTTETLTRGVVALKSGESTFISWRLLATDSDDTKFDLLRDGKIISKDMRVTNFTDTHGKPDSRYQVVTKTGDTCNDTTAAVTRWNDIFKRIRLDRPAGKSTYNYFPNDCGTGDVDGDGEYELIVKWDPSNTQDNANDGRTGNVYLDCYRMTGEKLWRIDLGRNIRAGAHYTQFLVYDFDGDGMAEVMCKTAPGTTDGQGNYVSMAADDMEITSTDNNKDYTNSSGRILNGPEFLTVFNGVTGKAEHTVWYRPNRGFGTGGSADYSSLWGDDWETEATGFLHALRILME